MSLLHSLVVCFKRVLCFLRPRRRTNDSLPFTVSSQDAVYSLDGLRGEVPSAQRWDEWSEKPFSDPVEDKINEYRKKVTLEREQMTRRLTQGDEEELEPDYFNEMAPEVKKTKKLLLKQKQQTQRRDLFAVSNEPDIPVSNGFHLLSTFCP
uniref:Uncharacterized protein n=1 Tax=Plectus sambesii TaxID=2011161 RepID=A0A914WSF0_9BILA